MPVPSGAQRASRQALPRHRGWAILLAILVGTASAAALLPAAPAAAATAPKVAVIVGPAGSNTALFRDLANKAAAEARRYTSNVVRVYSPNATWSRVKTAIRGATVVVYLGRGRGFPSPYSTTLRRSSQDGFGLNPTAGANNSTTKYYGESYVRTVPLAPNAVILLSHVRYAPGYSEAGRPQPTRSVARRRVDNYGAGFLAAGASAVIAEATGSPVYYIRTVFTRTMTLDAMWRAAPNFHGHVTSFSSTRTPGAVGRTDPVYATSRYYRSIVGRLTTSTAAVRGGSAAPTPAPTPTPAPANTVTVPASIDATGASDVSAALNSFIKSTPDGSTIVFKAGGTYRLDQGLVLANRHNLAFEGNGATLRATSTGTASLGSPFRLNPGNSYITIRNFTLVGSNPNTTTVYNPGQEDQMGVLIYGGTNIEIAHNTISHTWGDGVYIGPNISTQASSNSVWVHDNTFSYVGRSGIALTAASNVTVERNSFDKVGLHVFDIEPDYAWEVNTFDTFRNNTVGSYGLSTAYVGFLFASNGAAGSTVHDVTVTGNTVTGNPHQGYDGSPRGLNTYVTAARQQNIVFTTNTTTMAAAGPVLYFANVDGVTVTGNRQPLLSGSQAQFSNCTGVVYP